MRGKSYSPANETFCYSSSLRQSRLNFLSKELDVLIFFAPCVCVFPTLSLNYCFGGSSKGSISQSKPILEFFEGRLICRGSNGSDRVGLLSDQ